MKSDSRSRGENFTEYVLHNWLLAVASVCLLLTIAASASSETLLHTFQGGSGGQHPYGALIVDASGILYGTTWSGGDSQSGTVFRLTPSNGSYLFSVLYSFKGGKDGAFPYSKLDLYGTTFQGGVGTGCTQGIGGCGVVFKLTPSGGSYTETVIYSFRGGKDGYHP